MRATKRILSYAKEDAAGKSELSSPEELISLLYDKACASVRRTVTLSSVRLEELPIEEKLANIEEYGKSVSNALQIITALREILDMEKGGELARQLSTTYSAIASSIWKASQNKDSKSLEKTYEAIDQLRLGWQEATTSPK